MSVIIVHKRAIFFTAVAALPLVVVIFLSGYLLGRVQRPAARIELANLAGVELLQPLGFQDLQEDEDLLTPQNLPEEDAADLLADTEQADSSTAQIAILVPGAELPESEQQGTKVQAEKSGDNGGNLALDSAPATHKASAQTAAVEKRGFALQVAAFGNLANAESYRDVMSSKGYQRVFVYEDQGSRLTHAVRLGFYEKYADALRAAEAFRKAEKREPMVVNRVISE